MSDRDSHFRMMSVVLLTFALLISASAGDKPDRLTALDVFTLQYAGDPQISPDGKRMVYVRQFSDVMSDKHYSNLWAISADGSEDRALTSGNYSDGSPRWSPDGTRIAYISDRDGKPQLYVRWMDSGQIASLTNLENAPSDIAWSPDGKRIAGRSASGEAILFDRETQKLQVMPGIEPGEVLSKWTEDGRALLAYSAAPWEARIYRVETATGKRTLLQTVEPREKAGSLDPIRLAYAERSKTYVYSSMRVLGILYVVEGLE